MANSPLRDIVLSASRGSWRMLERHADESDRRYRDVYSRVLKRDNSTCQYCGFRAVRFQELHHLDDNHGNNDPSNLATACCLCHQCFHLGLAGVRSSGLLIWAPELTQAELNNVARAVFVANLNGGEQAGPARDLYRALEARHAVVELEMGEGASHPAALAQAFLEMSPEQYDTRAGRLAGLRLLPRQQGFNVQVAYWKGDPGAFGALADGQWGALAPDSLREQIARLAEASKDDAAAPPDLSDDPLFGTDDLHDPDDGDRY